MHTRHPSAASALALAKPNPLLEPYAWWIGGIGLSLIFPVIGMIADKRRYGAIQSGFASLIRRQILRRRDLTR